MDIVVWVLIVILILIILYFGICAYAVLTMTKIGDHPQYDQDPGSFGLAYEKVYFQSRGEKLRLAAWFVPRENANQAIILVHGRNASKQNAISGRLPSLAAECVKAGFSVLMMDLRGHGESEGRRYTWGVLERKDVLGAVDFLLEKGYLPGTIYVLGISLGGASVMFATQEEPAIARVVVDSTFARLIDLVEPNWKKESGLPDFFLPGVYFVWKTQYGFNLKDVAPVEAVSAIYPRPVLVLHSQKDEVIPVQQAYQLAKASPQVQLHLFEDGDHAELYRDHPQAYLKVLFEFLRPE
jgi:alpha-beta hydrolase superfamily lysophospholipase